MRLLLVANGLPPREWAGVELDTYHLALALAKRHEVYLYVRAADRARPEYFEWDEVDGLLRVRRIVNNFLDSDNFVSLFRKPQIDERFDRYLDLVQPDVVHFQHVIGLSATLISRVKSRSLPSVLTLHDYWWVCSRVQLLRADFTPCPGPSHAFDCVTCLSDRRVAPTLERRSPLQRIQSALTYQRNAGTSFPKLATVLAQRAWDALFERRPPKQEADDWRLRLHDYRLRLMLRLLGYPDVVTVPSRSAKDYLTTICALDPNRLRVVPLGIEPVAPISVRAHAGRLRIGYVGTVAPQKGVHLLVDAVARLRPLDLELHVYGTDTGLFGYTQKLRSFDARVVYHGAYRSTDLRRIFQEIDVLVLPSIWPETFSIVLREALSAGLPVVASRIGAIPELIRDGENGLLVTPGSVDDLAAALERLAREPTLRQRLVSVPTPIRSVADYADELEQIYLEVLTLASRGMRHS